MVTAGKRAVVFASFIFTKQPARIRQARGGAGGGAGEGLRGWGAGPAHAPAAPPSTLGCSLQQPHPVPRTPCDNPTPYRPLPLSSTQQVLGQVYVSDANIDDDLVKSISLPAQHPNAAEVFYRVITGA